VYKRRNARRIKGRINLPRRTITRRGLWRDPLSSQCHSRALFFVRRWNRMINDPQRREDPHSAAGTRQGIILSRSGGFRRPARHAFVPSRRKALSPLPNTRLAIVQRPRECPARRTIEITSANRQKTIASSRAIRRENARCSRGTRVGRDVHRDFPSESSPPLTRHASDNASSASNARRATSSGHRRRPASSYGVRNSPRNYPDLTWEGRVEEDRVPADYADANSRRGP